MGSLFKKNIKVMIKKNAKVYHEFIEGSLNCTFRYLCSFNYLTPKPKDISALGTNNTFCPTSSKCF